VVGSDGGEDKEEGEVEGQGQKGGRDRWRGSHWLDDDRERQRARISLRQGEWKWRRKVSKQSSARLARASKVQLFVLEGV